MQTVDLEAIMNEPAASDWLKNSLAQALQRDPVDAANDAEILASLLCHRAEEVLHHDDPQLSLLPSLTSSTH